MRIRWLLAPCLLLLAGCAVGPDYRRPPVAPPEQFRGTAAEDAGAAGALTDRPWWEIFDDPELKALIDEALRSNYDVRVAAWRVAEFRARAGIARSEFFPQI